MHYVLLESEEFVDCIKKHNIFTHLDEVPAARRLAAPSLADVLKSAAKETECG